MRELWMGIVVVAFGVGVMFGVVMERDKRHCESRQNHNDQAG